MALDLQEQTKQQLAARLAVEFRVSTKLRTVAISRVILALLFAGEIDADEWMAAFALRRPAWNKLLKRMQDLIVAWAVVEDADGAQYADH